MPASPAPRRIVTQEAWDARARSPLRGWLAFPLWALWASGVILGLAVMAVVVPRVLRRRFHDVCHLWGRGLLAISGVRLDVRGLEHLNAVGPALLYFNHQSLMDLALLTATWPEGGTVLYKREFHRIPLMGWVMRRAGLIPIDRNNRRAAIKSLDEAARAVTQRGAKVLISPEGTRSRRGGLLPFKRGPFHLALQTRAPVVPLVFRGVTQLMPQGTYVCRPGVIGVELLEPIDTSDWSEQHLDRHVADVRSRFLELLPEAPPGPR